MVIRPLGVADAVAYRALRIRAVTAHPDAFLISGARERAIPLAEIRERFRTRWAHPDNRILGAFRDGLLVGLCGFFREPWRKVRHKATIWGVYVAPEARGLGLGRALLDAAVARLRKRPGILQVHLCVTLASRAALALYRSAGFRTFGVEPRAMRVGGRFLDEAHMVRRLDRRR